MGHVTCRMSHHQTSQHCFCFAFAQFVSMDGYRKFGLVHSSQVSNYLSFSREDTDEQKKSELVRLMAPPAHLGQSSLIYLPSDGCIPTLHVLDAVFILHFQSGVVTVGEAVFVKVVEIIEDDGSGRGPKIQCSMKARPWRLHLGACTSVLLYCCVLGPLYSELGAMLRTGLLQLVDQKSGEDLDPMNSRQGGRCPCRLGPCWGPMHQRCSCL